ncbi:MAG: MBL fold metallo-hydrolase [Deltaproteobacteria bacterium]|jgi:glyoxylase-like metal-dependent hydrolase (beta-lactamase superfamily II)|nr:MBL fold metallo-hydrolase [Deltaproteobacteria bacterium]
MRIAPDVYFYPFAGTMENNCNTIVLTGSQPVIIDPGHKHLWPRLADKLDDDGLNPADFKLALFTHCHPDHMEAGQVLEEKFSLTQAMGREEKVFYDGPGQAFFPWMGLDLPSGYIGRLIDPGPLDLGDKVLDVYLSPGHSPGSLCFHWPQERLLITGDVIFARSFGRYDFPGGNLAQLIKSIEALQGLPPAAALLPGHGPAVMGEAEIRDNFSYVLEMMKSFPG